MRKKQTRSALVAFAGVVLLAAACAGPRHGARGRAANWREEGLASWYGADFHGRRTANGERYNMYAMTAAHKTLPLGTHVTVTDRRTGRRVRVRVNDRGPFVAGRVIDLSLAAARRLGSAAAGVVPVLVEADLPAAAFAAAPPPGAPPHAPPPLRGVFAVQVGAFTVETNARRLAERLAGDARVLAFDDNRGRWWRVRVGRHADEAAARAAAERLAAAGLPGMVVRED